MIRLSDFAYFEPTALPEAVEILAEKRGEALPLAGGTDLLPRMKRGTVHPSALVNLKRIKGLTRIEGGNGKGVSLGALATISAIEGSDLIRSGYSVLAEAAGVLGSASIRNLATLGGNVGRASPASDMVPALMVLGALATVEGPSGKREIGMSDLFSGPGATTLSPGEVITTFHLPALPAMCGAAYMKLGRTLGVDVALVGAAALLILDGKGGEAKEARVALASVAPVTLRSGKAEEALRSGPLTEERLAEAARAAAEDCSPISDIRASASYRKEMVRVLTFRALEKALELAKGGKRT